MANVASGRPQTEVEQSGSMFTIANRGRELFSAKPKTWIALIAFLVFGLSEPLYAADDTRASNQSDQSQVNGKSNDADSKQYSMVTADYVVPDITLSNAEGKPVRLRELLSQPRPVLLQFIFTSCSTICPLLSATFSRLQRELDHMKLDYQMISISIDPEYDVTDRLSQYAKRYHAGSRWMFLTGQKQDIRNILAAFDALYQSDNKMYHRPLFYLRAAPDASWLRIEGFITVADMMNQFRSVIDLAKNTVR